MGNFIFQVLKNENTIWNNDVSAEFRNKALLEKVHVFGLLNNETWRFIWCNLFQKVNSLTFKSEIQFAKNARIKLSLTFYPVSNFRIPFKILTHDSNGKIWHWIKVELFYNEPTIANWTPLWNFKITFKKLCEFLLLKSDNMETFMRKKINNKNFRTIFLSRISDKFCFKFTTRSVIEMSSKM